jgi:hypothetical protein
MYDRGNAKMFNMPSEMTRLFPTHVCLMQLLYQIEKSNIAFYLRHSYTGNATVLGHKAKSNGTPPCFSHNLPFIGYTIVSVSCDKVIQFNSYMVSATRLHRGVTPRFREAH